MSGVQRIEFEDRGQDFLWWEIDTETGRILGCGPHQGWLWADGDHRVDLSTIGIGQRPSFYHRRRMDVITLKYVIVSAGPAPAGGR
ncbi:hypothetical protein H2509_13425 [Stappia sp. F7233]|uniref:Uncharacterized protein n=1 Tax=Stappia albiluteola TaxID=2758565 RepID=A0A839AG65_9HYPH|nr:hypothetical protein [Stappia albiluteola]MBA5777453.1 hypothetical protein [Stappia albiluteola]MBA5777491.1 hypothetical protein [Stappia albiluteola]MBA5778098.1 hypothetical protein [Stappia albiluteola]MBA5778125.1 hypothetical protein [Stappia albiluteola]